MSLIACRECNHQISELAASCPQCGAPNQVASKAVVPAESPKATGAGTKCPFSGHTIPAGATVCACGSWYGYNGGRGPAEPVKAIVAMLVVGVVCLVAMKATEGGSTGDTVRVFGWVVIVCAALITAKAVFCLMRGKKWWRRF